MLRRNLRIIINREGRISDVLGETIVIIIAELTRFRLSKKSSLYSSNRLIFASPIRNTPRKESYRILPGCFYEGPHIARPPRSATTTTPLLRTTKSSHCDENRLLGTNDRMFKKIFLFFLTSFGQEWGTLFPITIKTFL